MSPRLRKLVTVTAALILMIVVVGAWQCGPLRAYADPHVLAALERRAAGTAWAPFAAIALFVVGGLVAMPLSLLILVTTLAFGPVQAMVYAYLGCNASAVVTYALGLRFGSRLVPLVVPAEHLAKVQGFLSRRGFAAMLALRFSPVGHFSVESLIAGFLKVAFRPFILATLLGTLPEVLVLTTLGHAVKRYLHHAKAEDAVIIAVAAAVIVLVYLLNRRHTRRR